MPTILPHRTVRTPVNLTGLCGDPELASELSAPTLPGETLDEALARRAAAADIYADLAPGHEPDPPHTETGAGAEHALLPVRRAA